MGESSYGVVPPNGGAERTGVTRNCEVANSVEVFERKSGHQQHALAN